VSTGHPIQIIGGGLAGLTLGIALRRLEVPVTIWEAGHYPRHRVCGEFISGRGQQVLARLGLEAALHEAGARLARHAAVFIGTAGSPVRALVPPALCLSRFTLDALLAKDFRMGGGDLRENARHCGEFAAEGTVRASGRRSHVPKRGWQWFGLKVHARQVTLAADLELHAMRQGYVGLCRLNEHEVNVCGLFRRRGQPARLVSWQECLRGASGSRLHERLAAAEFQQDSFCAIAGLSLRSHRAAERSECCIGDALTMIPPATGNGMSMAFEAAELAVAPLVRYSRGELSWAQAREAVARACDRAFARRLAWAGWLQLLLTAPAFRGRLGQALIRSARVWQLMFAGTR